MTNTLSASGAITSPDQTHSDTEDTLAVGTPSADLNLLYGGWLSTEQLAQIIGVDASTLRRWRNAEPVQGPPFVPFSGGVIKYSAQDVQKWLESRRVDPKEAA